ASLFPTIAWSAVLLGLLSVHKFHAMARVDLPLLALTVATVAQIVRFVDGRRTAALAGAAAAAAAAVLVKPTAVVTLLACAGWAAFALRHSPRDLGRLALALGAGAAVWAAVTAGMQIATGGEYLRQTVELHTLKGTWPSAWIWEGYVDRYLPVLVAGAVALLLPADPLLKLLACITTGWAILSTRAAGADLNYTLEPLTWTTLLVASASTGLLRKAEGAGTRARVLGTLGAAAVVIALLPLRGGPVRAGEMSAETREEGAELDRLMEASHGVTLSEEPFFAVLRGKELIVTDPFGLSVMAGRGRFDQRPLLKELDEGRIARVFLGADLQADVGIRDSLRRRYRQVYITQGKLADTRWIVLEPATDP
ncbi:MAG TPA: hypothetical protein VKU85_06790, partial [bacterium]|nr:hypothetical protein [bacterium]